MSGMFAYITAMADMAEDYGRNHGLNRDEVFSNMFGLCLDMDNAAYQLSSTTKFSDKWSELMEAKIKADENFDDYTNALHEMLNFDFNVQTITNYVAVCTTLKISVPRELIAEITRN